MINFIIGVFIGCIIGVIALAVCVAGGRTDLEMRITELERKCYNLQTENVELISRLK